MATLCQGSAILILGLFCTKCSAECSITNEIFAHIYLYMYIPVSKYMLVRVIIDLWPCNLLKTFLYSMPSLGENTVACGSSNIYEDKMTKC